MRALTRPHGFEKSAGRRVCDCVVSPLRCFNQCGVCIRARTCARIHTTPNKRSPRLSCGKTWCCHRKCRVCVCVKFVDFDSLTIVTITTYTHSHTQSHTLGTPNGPTMATNANSETTNFHTRYQTNERQTQTVINQQADQAIVCLCHPYPEAKLVDWRLGVRHAQERPNATATVGGEIAAQQRTAIGQTHAQTVRWECAGLAGQQADDGSGRQPSARVDGGHVEVW